VVKKCSKLASFESTYFKGAKIGRVGKKYFMGQLNIYLEFEKSHS